ncbi:hypothetical protein TcasGA2_TC004353 [Tribolium castaneum]|uniref:SAP domain-containing protein n=1 Tax=Tribolium castaneum TaxID=7070 RepID=D7GXX2_TRICA|nr:hypothetical protein TcasGA2_TC004353 [Tribolium castaneum]
MSGTDDELDSDTEAGDIRVGWIYRLRKQELISDLKRFGLSTEGTVEELRRRLRQFVKENAAAVGTFLESTVRALKKKSSGGVPTIHTQKRRPLRNGIIGPNPGIRRVDSGNKTVEIRREELHEYHIKLDKGKTRIFNEHSATNVITKTKTGTKTHMELEQQQTV